MNANHNSSLNTFNVIFAVILSANIKNERKSQPKLSAYFLISSCDSICKYNKMNANHNRERLLLELPEAVILSANIIK